MKILCDDDRIVWLKSILPKDSLPFDIKYYVEHDALTKDGNPILSCCLLDIPRLFRFKAGISLHEKIGKVITFDFQSEMLARYLGDKVEIVPVNFEKFMTRFV